MIPSCANGGVEGQKIFYIIAQIRIICYTIWQM